MVSAILTVKCGASLAALTCGTLAAYMAFTFSVTQVCVCPGFGTQTILCHILCLWPSA